VRRLFSTFAHGPPGIGLLLLRLVTGIAAVAPAIAALRGGEPTLGLAFFSALLFTLGSLLIAGFFTPVAGAMVAVTALCTVFLYPVDPWYCVLVGTLGIVIALIGPGAWSVDARFFGWKRY
jgi:hypothetical protein